MKFTDKAIQGIHNVINFANSVGIQSVIFDENGARGINDNTTCIMMWSEKLDDFTKQKMGLGRLNVLLQRLDLIKKSSGDFTITGTESKDKKDIATLEIASKKSKVQFRCVNSNLIKAPVAVNDTTFWEMVISAPEIELIQQSVKLMGAKQIPIITKDKKSYYIEISDSTKETLILNFDNELSWVHDDTSLQKPFTHVYSAEVLLPALRHAANANGCVCSITETGIIKIKVGDFTELAILPMVEE